MEQMKKGQYKDIILAIDEENKKCVDCGKDNPTKTSVNNGVVICEECAAKHSQLGPTISYVRDLGDTFDEYLLNYFTLGGNSKFKRFINEEKVDTSLPIDKKYLTKACEFYRINLKMKVSGEKLLEKKYDNPNEIIEKPENHFPEFENYDLKFAKQENKSTIDQAKKILGNLGSGLFSFGKKVFDGAKQGANFVATKAKPATTQIKKGASFMTQKVGDMYTNIKNKIATTINKDKKDGGEKKEDKVEDKKEEQKEEQKEEKNDENNENKNDIKEDKVDNNNNGKDLLKEEDKKKEDPTDSIGVILNQPLANEQAQGQNEKK